MNIVVPKKQVDGLSNRKECETNTDKSASGVEMKTLNILGDNRFETFSKTRTGCRGIVVNDGKILVSREVNVDLWLIPGGGLEEGEKLAECCAREVLEETGFIVEPVEEYLLVNEYYEEYKYVTHYFICRMVGIGQQNLTDEEKQRGLIPKWLDLQDLLSIFSEHQKYAETNEMKRGMYLREYTALKEFLGA